MIPEKALSKVLFDDFDRDRSKKTSKIYGTHKVRNKAWETLKPLLKRLKEEAQSQEYKYCDKTPICMIKDKKSLRHYLWCLYTDKAVYFEVSSE